MHPSQKFKQWLKTMGYEGKICDSVKDWGYNGIKPNLEFLSFTQVFQTSGRERAVFSASHEGEAQTGSNGEEEKPNTSPALKNDVVQYPIEELCVCNEKEVEFEVKELEVKIREDGFALGKLQMQICKGIWANQRNMIFRCQNTKAEAEH